MPITRVVCGEKTRGSLGLAGHQPRWKKTLPGWGETLTQENKPESDTGHSMSSSGLHVCLQACVSTYICTSYSTKKVPKSHITRDLWLKGVCWWVWWDNRGVETLWEREVKGEERERQKHHQMPADHKELIVAQVQKKLTKIGIIFSHFGSSYLCICVACL